MEGKIQTFHTLTLDGDECTDSRPSRIYPGERFPSASLFTVVKKKYLCPCLNIKIGG